MVQQGRPGHEAFYLLYRVSTWVQTLNDENRDCSSSGESLMLRLFVQEAAARD